MIRARYLEALEEERVDALPEGPYQRSFLREYAEYLGLDGDILVAEWIVRFPPPAPELPSQPSRAMGIGSALSALEHRRALRARPRARCRRDRRLAALERRFDEGAGHADHALPQALSPRRSQPQAGGDRPIESARDALRR